MKREVIECDVCGKVKQNSVNHWYMIDEGKESLSLSTWDFGKFNWEPKPLAKHICGQECVQKFVSNWMNGK